MIDQDIINKLIIVDDYKKWEHKYGIIEGFLGATEGYALLLLAEKGAGQGEIVEIGSYMGRSTCWIACGAKRGKREKVTAIDTFGGSKEHKEIEVIQQQGTTFIQFMNNLKKMGLDDYVMPIVSKSELAVKNWNKPIRLLFIDGEHTYEQVKLDYELWSPFIVNQGFLCFHDINDWEGPTKFYNELKKSSTIFQEIICINSFRAMVRIK